MGSALMGSLQCSCCLTGGTFWYSRQIYAPLLLACCFKQGIFNLLRASRTRIVWGSPYSTSFKPPASLPSKEQRTKQSRERRMRARTRAPGYAVRAAHTMRRRIRCAYTSAYDLHMAYIHVEREGGETVRRWKRTWMQNHDLPVSVK